MSDPQTPTKSPGEPAASPGFDALCAEVQDFEHLPTLTAPPATHPAEDGGTAPLDEQILAGLVSP